MADSMPSDPAPRQNHATYLGFDYGERNTGVAVGQRITGTATGLETIRSSSEDALWSAVDRLVKTWQPSAFVVGMPYHPEEGVENPIVQPILHFCRELERRYQRPAYTFDETLSTKESQEIFYNKRSKRSVQFADIKDELAAQLILQTWLNHTATRNTTDA
jgi:putative Holliday junction resolvase